MQVTVHPEAFSLVLFESAEIRALAEQLATEIGLPADLQITIEIDETTPLGNAPRRVARSRDAHPRVGCPRRREGASPARPGRVG